MILLTFLLSVASANNDFFSPNGGATHMYVTIPDGRTLENSYRQLGDQDKQFFWSQEPTPCASVGEASSMLEAVEQCSDLLLTYLHQGGTAHSDARQITSNTFGLCQYSEDGNKQMINCYFDGATP